MIKLAHKRHTRRGKQAVTRVVPTNQRGLTRRSSIRKRGNTSSMAGQSLASRSRGSLTSGGGGGSSAVAYRSSGTKSGTAKRASTTTAARSSTAATSSSTGTGASASSLVSASSGLLKSLGGFFSSSGTKVTHDDTGQALATTADGSHVTDSDGVLQAISSTGEITPAIFGDDVTDLSTGLDSGLATAETGGDLGSVIDANVVDQSDGMDGSSVDYGSGGYTPYDETSAPVDDGSGASYSGIGTVVNPSIDYAPASTDYSSGYSGFDQSSDWSSEDSSDGGDFSFDSRCPRFIAR